MLESYLMEETYNKWPEWQKVCIDKKNFLALRGFLPQSWGYKHACNKSDKVFLLTSKFFPKGLSAPVLGLYTCIKSLKNVYKIGLLKLVTNDRSDKMFLLT